MQGQLKQAAQEWASLFTNLPLKKWWQAAPGWISLLMVILVAKSASNLTWIIFAPAEQGNAAGMTRQSVSQAPVEGTQVRLRTVADLHLLGVASKAPIISDAPIEATETKLKLTLRGVFAATDPLHAMAIIADARGDEKVYKKSETIFSGVTLYEIYPDKVILERGGSFETLSLPREELEGSSSQPAMVSTRTARPTTRKTQAGVARTRTVKAGKRLEQLKEKLTTEPAEFWKEVRIEPVQDENNQIKGYSFNHNDQQVMTALGLRPGDVIVEVNGNPVSDPSVLSSLITDLGSQQSISLGIERNGQREDLNIQM